MTARKLELGCWFAALMLTVVLATSTASAAPSAATRAKVTASDLLRSVMTSASSGWCIKEVIESVPRWPSSRDLNRTIDRLCFGLRAPHLALHPKPATNRACVQPVGWRSTVTRRSATGCLMP